MQMQQEQDYTKRFDAGLWVRLVKYLKPYHKHIFAVAIAMTISAVCDMIYPLLTREAIDGYIAAGRVDGLGGFVAGYGGTVFVQTLCILFFCLVSGKAECGINRHIRLMCFKRLEELSFSYYDRTPVGYIISRMTSDTARLGETVAWGLLDLFWGASYIVVTCVAMFFLNWRLALLVVAVMPVIAVIAVWFQKRILDGYRIVRKTNSQITGAFNEGIMGAKTSKTLVREQANCEEFGVLTGTMKRASIRAAVLSALFMPIVSFLGVLATAAVILKGGHDVLYRPDVLSIGTLVAFASYATSIFEPISNIARIFADLQASQAAAERVIGLLETDPEIFDTPEVVEKFGDSFRPRRENWPDIRGDVEFEHVTFHYNGGEEVLEDFNLKVKAGQTVALVGETGSGKSTIVNLVCRFYEPVSGRIKIDGEDYRSRSMLWLQSHLGYVLQQPHLFSGTIRENIRFGRLDATDAEIEEAARMVDAESFILQLEKGYDTEVGEGGNRLSTGQKQLISFARALIANPAIFILDEATSSVDTETEQKLQAAIATALRGRTSFIVAHRLSTIRSADMILVIRNGRIQERGTHRELLRQRGYYYQHYANQFREEQMRASWELAAGEAGA